MASMDMLIKEIYFEKQQEGSMLCAQHALNSLLQGEYFTPPDLAAIATKLDQLESGYDDANLGDTSTNMDDTGFFSIQVIEEALKPWSLSLRRWRSEVMLPYHDRPHCQLAFILNSQQHWYTLRRFGEAVPDFTQDLGVGHWFNLNSFNEHPMWVGKTYLSMTLQQAEEAGYSVFAVIQDDPAKPLALPRGEADYVAAFVTEDARPSTAYTTGGNQPSTSKVDKGLEDLDDEDAELQAALQASISGNAYTEPDSFAQPSFAAAASRAAHAPHTPRTPIQGARSVASLPPLRRPTLRDFEMIDDDDDDSEYPPVIPPRLEPEANLDPLEASRARSQAYMQQVMREQEAALRESRDAEALAIEAGFRTRRNRQQEQEDDELRRAIEASLASHEVGTSGSGAREMPIEVNEEIADEEEVEYLGSGSASRSEQRQPLAEITHGADRVYDDEDAELQAALRASLEGVPPGFTMPDTPPRATAPLPISLPFVDASTKTNVPPPTTVNDEDDHTETESEADTTFAEEEEREQVSMEEMRRRRLARFGG